MIKKKISLSGENLLLARTTLKDTFKEKYYKSKKNTPFKEYKFYSQPLNYKKYK